MNLPADKDFGPGADASAADAADDDAANDDAADDVASADDAAADNLTAAARRAARRKMLDEVFGDVLPTVTRDELDDGSDRSGSDRDRWYRDNRPPHHG